MKKSLSIVLALVFVLGIAATAFAANPFVDVPAKHWAYGAVSQLAKAGIVDGYDDNTFRGDKTMTRYEMAQVVAKAMAKSDKADAANKALIEKLAAEFSAELNNLGVRVSNLEKNQSNLKFTADVRPLRWQNTQNTKDGELWKDRFRLNMTSQINENTSLYARFVYDDDAVNNENHQRLSDMALTTKGFLPNTAVTVGRYTLNLGPTTYFSGTTGDVSGIMTNTKSGDFGLMLGYAQARQTVNNLLVNSLTIKNFGYAEGTYTTGKAKFNVDYFKNYGAGSDSGLTTTTDATVTTVAVKDVDGNITGYNSTVVPGVTTNVKVSDAYKIFGGGLAYTFDNNWKVSGEYYTNSAQDAKWHGNSPKAEIIHVAYKGASNAIPNSFGVALDWVRFEGNALPYGFEGPMFLVNPKSFGLNAATEGYKAYNAEFDYTLAKNVSFNLMYQFNIKSLNTGTPYDHFTRAQITYFF